ncbi:MAG: hypothetical protein AAF358_00900 [Pseudomonadota bacterium]
MFRHTPEAIIYLAALLAATPVLAQEQPANSFNPATLGTLDAIAFDPVSGNVFIHESFGMIHQFTPSGVEVGTPLPTPGTSSNDIDLDFAPIDISVGATLVSQDTLLIGNGERDPETIYAVSIADGSIIASAPLPEMSSQTVGVAYHASRDTLFVLDWTGDQLFEASSVDGTILNTFPVAPAGTPAYDVFFGDVEVSQSTGNLLIVSSASSGRMRELTATGEFVRDVDLSGGPSSNFSGIALDDETGDIWLSTTSGDVLQFGALGDIQSVDEETAVAGDTFGSSVAVDGNLMVVGLPGSDLTGTDAGAVGVYRIEGGTTVLETVLPVPDGFTAAGFGASVAVSGDTIVVGTSGEVPPAKVGAASLAAAIFQRRAGGGGFSFKQPLTGNGMSSGTGRFGAAVSISGDSVVVGAPDDDEDEMPGMGTGAAYVFRRPSRGMPFQPPTKIKPPQPDPAARFGASVAVRGRKIAIGAPRAKPSGGPATGSASIYDAVAGAVTRLGSVSGSGSGEGARFGSSVNVDNDGTVLVGAPMEAEPGKPSRGTAYLFGTTSPLLNQISQIKPEDPVDDGEFGAAVAIDRGTIIIGSPRAINGGIPNGAVYRYRKSGNTVNQVSRTAPLPGQTGLGASVAVSDDRVLSGAPQTQGDVGSALLQLDTGLIFRSGFE